MDNVDCTGRYWLEAKLTDCPFDTHTADCTHSQDAGVYCLTECEMTTLIYYEQYAILSVATHLP